MSSGWFTVNNRDTGGQRHVVGKRFRTMSQDKETQFHRASFPGANPTGDRLPRTAWKQPAGRSSSTAACFRSGCRASLTGISAHPAGRGRCRSDPCPHRPRGLLPRFVQQGFQGPMIATRPTAALVGNDAARGVRQLRGRCCLQAAAACGTAIQKASKLKIKPLYTVEDVHRVLPLRARHSVSRAHRSLPRHHREVLRRGAHPWLGEHRADGDRSERQAEDRFFRIIEQMNKPIIRDPELLQEADYVVMESTYGDRVTSRQGTSKRTRRGACTSPPAMRPWTSACGSTRARRDRAPDHVGRRAAGGRCARRQLARLPRRAGRRRSPLRRRRCALPTVGARSAR